MNDIELLATLESRRSGYVFLSQVYAREVTLDFLRKLRDAPQGVDRMLKEFTERLKGSDLREVELELATEYAALFLNVGKYPVFLFESVYTSKEKLLMQEARDEVLSEYRKEGLDKIEGFKEPEDHIAIELEFMSYLCQKTIDSIKNSDSETTLAYLNKQKDFLEKHLMVWVPAFCIDLEQATKSDFYQGIAKLTKNFMEVEEENLIQGGLIEHRIKSV